MGTGYAPDAFERAYADMRQAEEHAKARNSDEALSPTDCSVPGDNSSTTQEETKS